VDFSELKELIRILEQSGLSELEVEENGRRIRLQKAVAPVPVVAPVAIAPSVAPVPVAYDPGYRPATSAPVAPAAPAEDDATGGLPTFDSPMVGTFYRAPSPEADVFVKVGDRVEENQTICIIEAMKLMNEVGAKFSGVIEKILVENAQAVEFGQPLFVVRRD
jgi:acetyl-CoA carboxylase biotin carboxyl carrier protein